MYTVCADLTHCRYDNNRRIYRSECLISSQIRSEIVVSEVERGVERMSAVC